MILIIGNEISNILYFQKEIRIFIVISDMAMQMFFDGYYVKKKLSNLLASQKAPKEVLQM